MTLQKSVGRFIEEHALIPRAGVVLVGYSGGGDSTALLDILLRLAPERGWRVSALHVDHGLRREAGAEAAAAAEMARQMGAKVQVVQLSLQAGGNLQERAREARLAALRERARASGEGALVALGHTADDQAETVLMRLVRGTGPAGLAGMAPREGQLVRPILTQRRAAVRAYLEGRGLPHLQDPSNKSVRFMRTRAREHWLPLLEESNPRVVDAITRLAANAAQERRTLTRLVKATLEARWHEGGSGELGRVDLQGLEDARELLPTIVRAVYARIAGTSKGVSRAHLAQLQRLWQRGGSRGVDLPHLRLELRYGQLVALPRGRLAAGLESVRVGAPGEYDLGRGCVVRVEECRATGALDDLPVARLKGEVMLRSRAPGDRMRIGPQGRRRIGRIMIDAKIEKALRARRPLVVHDGEPVLLIGVRRAAKWAPPPGAMAWRFSISS